MPESLTDTQWIVCVSVRDFYTYIIWMNPASPCIMIGIGVLHHAELSHKHSGKEALSKGEGA